MIYINVHKYLLRAYTYNYINRKIVFFEEEEEGKDI